MHVKNFLTQPTSNYPREGNILRVRGPPARRHVFIGFRPVPLSNSGNTIRALTRTGLHTYVIIYREKRTPQPAANQPNDVQPSKQRSGYEA